MDVRGDYTRLNQTGTLLSCDHRKMFGQELGRLQVDQSLTVPGRPDDVHEQAMPHGPILNPIAPEAVPLQRIPRRFSDISRAVALATSDARDTLDTLDALDTRATTPLCATTYAVSNFCRNAPRRLRTDPS